MRISFLIFFHFVSRVIFLFFISFLVWLYGRSNESSQNISDLDNNRKILFTLGMYWVKIESNNKHTAFQDKFVTHHKCSRVQFCVKQKSANNLFV